MEGTHEYFEKEIDRMSYVDEVLERVKAKNASEPEFLQAVGY